MKSLSTSHFSTQQERRIKNPNWSKDCLSLPDQTTMRAEAASSSRPRFKSAPRSYPAGGANVIDDIGIDSEDDWLVSCNRCDKGGESLLSCCGCPIYLHASCITVNYAPQFDEFGKFWCPPCNYKRATDRFEEVRIRAVVAKKDLSAFMAGFGIMVGDDAKKTWIDAIKRKNDATKRKNDAIKRRNGAKRRRNDEMDLDREVRTEGVGGCENDMDGAGAKTVQCDHSETRAEVHEFVHRNEGEKTPGIESFEVSTTKENANVDSMVKVHEDEVLKNEGGIQKKKDRQVTASQDEGILHGKQVRHLGSCCVEETIISVHASDKEVLENEGEALENEGGIQKKDDGRVTGSQDQGILPGKLVQQLDSCCEEETVTTSASDENHESLEKQTQLTPSCQETTPCYPIENVALVVHGNESPSWRRILDFPGVWKNILGKRKSPL